MWTLSKILRLHHHWYKFVFTYVKQNVSIWIKTITPTIRRVLSLNVSICG